MAVNYNASIVKSGLILQLDASNPKSYSVNVHPKPTDLYQWVTAGNSVSVSRDTISSPVGTTPLKMTVTGNDPYLNSYNSSLWNLAPARSGQTWTVSFWVKASQATTGSVYIFGANSSGNYIEAPATSYNIYQYWTRVSFSTTFSNASTAYIQTRVGGTPSGGSGINIWFDGYQVERSSTMSNFNPVPNLNGNNLFDISGNGNHFTINGVLSWNSTTGFSGFDGNTYSDGNKIYRSNFPVNLKLSQGGTGITTMVLARSTGGGGAWRKLIGNSDSENYIDNYQSPATYFYTESGDSLYYNNGISVVDNTNLIINDSVWRLYIMTNLNAVGLSNPTYPLTIGNEPGTSNGYPWIGNISMVMMYNRILSTEEMTINFNAVRGRFNI